jgi:AcrR family transcriptional regulator
MGRTQEQRRTETRQRLLDAAASLIAQRGIAATSVDAIAEAAERTSGAVYDHFGGKDGLLVALLDRWKDAAGAVITAEFEASTTPEERLASLWRNVNDPPADRGAEWVLLEHELWLHASRHDGARPLVAERYAGARAGLAGALSGVDDPAARDERACDDPAAVARAAADEGATLVLALLLGLEMQRRLDPAAVPDDLAVRGLRALLDATRGADRPAARRALGGSSATPKG